MDEDKQQLIEKLKTEPTEENLWNTIVAFQEHQFLTASGLPYTYMIKKGRNGELTHELWISRRENSKSLSWSSIRIAFEKAKELEGPVKRPKAIGDIRGISYIYPLFWYFGLIEVPEDIACKMRDTNTLF